MGRSNDWDKRGRQKRVQTNGSLRSEFSTEPLQGKNARGYATHQQIRRVRCRYCGRQLPEADLADHASRCSARKESGPPIAEVRGLSLTGQKYFVEALRCHAMEQFPRAILLLKQLIEHELRLAIGSDDKLAAIKGYDASVQAGADGAVPLLAETYLGLRQALSNNLCTGDLVEASQGQIRAHFESVALQTSNDSLLKDTMSPGQAG